MMKKISFSVILGIILLGIGFNVYAQSSYDVSLFDLVRTRIMDKTNVNVEDYLEPKETEHKENLNEYISNKEQELDENYNNALNDGIISAEEELDAYVDGLKTEIDAIYEEETNHAINELNDAFKSETDRIKEALLAELEKIYQ